MKIGDKVKFNDKYGLEKNYPEKVFTVASEPWTVGDFKLVKLEGYGGGFRADGLEVIEEKEDAKDRMIAEYQQTLNRLRHLLESKFIASFDMKDPFTGEHIRNIAEADLGVSNMVPKFVFSGVRFDNGKEVKGSNLIQGRDNKGVSVCFIANSKDTFDAQTDSDGNIEIKKAIMYKVWPQTVSCKMYMQEVGEQ